MWYIRTVVCSSQRQQMVMHLALAWEPLWLFFATSKGSGSTVCQQMRYVHTLHNKMNMTEVKVRSHSDTTSAVWVAKYNKNMWLIAETNTGTCVLYKGWTRRTKCQGTFDLAENNTHKAQKVLRKWYKAKMQQL